MPEGFRPSPLKMPSTPSDPRPDDEDGYHSPLHPISLNGSTYPTRRRTWGGRSRRAVPDTQEPGVPVGVKLERAMRILVALREPEVPVGKPPTVLRQLRNIASGSRAS